MKPQPRCTDRDGLLDILMSPTTAFGEMGHFIDLLERETREYAWVGNGPGASARPVDRGAASEPY